MPQVNIITSIPPSLEVAQKVVGGPVELIQLFGGIEQMLVHEEGRLLGLPLNPAASAVVGTEIYGNVIILKGAARWR